VVDEVVSPEKGQGQSACHVRAAGECLDVELRQAKEIEDLDQAMAAAAQKK